MKRGSASDYLNSRKKEIKLNRKSYLMKKPKEFLRENWLKRKPSGRGRK